MARRAGLRQQAGCFGFGSLFIVTFAVFTAIQQRGHINEKNSWPETTATVTATWTRTSRGQDDDTREEHYAKYAYEVRGERIEAGQRVRVLRPKVGDRIRIRYSPEQPGYARIEGELESQYATTTCFGVVFGVVAIVCFAYLFATGGLRRRPADDSSGS